jgi:hypothetical protein
MGMNDDRRRRPAKSHAVRRKTADQFGYGVMKRKARSAAKSEMVGLRDIAGQMIDHVRATHQARYMIDLGKITPRKH